jgi:hypothetical protein
MHHVSFNSALLGVIGEDASALHVRVVSTVWCVCLVHAQVVQEAICPERRKGLDDQLSAVASITEVYVSGDLQVPHRSALAGSTVYLKSVHLRQHGARNSCTGLQHGTRSLPSTSTEAVAWISGVWSLCEGTAASCTAGSWQGSISTV